MSNRITYKNYFENLVTNERIRFIVESIISISTKTIGITVDKEFI